jgi:hypothetical protein
VALDTSFSTQAESAASGLRSRKKKKRIRDLIRSLCSLAENHEAPEEGVVDKPMLIASRVLRQLGSAGTRILLASSVNHT